MFETYPGKNSYVHSYLTVEKLPNRFHIPNISVLVTQPIDGIISQHYRRQKTIAVKVLAEPGGVGQGDIPQYGILRPWLHRHSLAFTLIASEQDLQPATTVNAITALIMAAIHISLDNEVLGCVPPDNRSPGRRSQLPLHLAIEHRRCWLYGDDSVKITVDFQCEMAFCRFSIFSYNILR